MADLSPEIQAHLEWLGFVQPTGLVVSASALVHAGAILERNDQETQRRLRTAVQYRAEGDLDPHIADFRRFASDVLGWSWSTKFYAGVDGAPIPDELRAVLADYDETLAPDFAVRERDPATGRAAWQLLVQVLPAGLDPDQPVTGAGRLELSSHARLERLLRRTGVPAGLLCNGRVLRLVSAPHGESSGWLDFRVADMLQTAGRPIATALRLLLSEPRLLALPKGERLAALLEASRKYQNEVSIALSGQVLHALYELVRGFQAAHDAAGRAPGIVAGEGPRRSAIGEALDADPDQVYRGLLTVLMRCVFLLYAEERDMLPRDEVFVRHYSLVGLYDRLRADAALHPDTMDQRFGAWAQILVLFRLVYDGARVGELRLPRRHGVLFDPNRFPFLEGRGRSGARQNKERIEAPLVPDGTVLRALEKLLVLDGERLSYRALDVEQIGSVYETMMGFRLETATGRSVAIKAGKPHGAPTTVDLDALLACKAGERAKWIESNTDRKLAEGAKKAVAAANTLEDLHAALQGAIDAAATPDLVPRGAMVLQPSAERRKSGSHYTPRELTEPIVRTTLAPILDQLVREHQSEAGGEPARHVPTPAQILGLKVLDPAMGSGAFLVEACRQLGDTLVEAWRVHGGRPELPPDEDDVLFARRLVAQRCLYGVDRNSVAVDLAKVSLWLATLARDHALTFVDHALRHGDSLVGLTRAEIEAFDWRGGKASFPKAFESMKVAQHVARVAELRARIRTAGDDVDDWVQRDLWDEARNELDQVRLFGDLVIAAYFDGAKDTVRQEHLRTYAAAVVNGTAGEYRRWLDERRHASPPLAPFHWQVEFPEVFDSINPGFDVVVGNPPFLGGQLITGSNGDAYFQWITFRYAPAQHYCDLVAYFLRQAYCLLRTAGTLGLVATKTIAIGDTRNGGLLPVVHAGGTIFSAIKRRVWPGTASVIVSIFHIIKGRGVAECWLDGRPCSRISAFLKHAGPDEDPEPLSGLSELWSEGSKIYGQGFLFDDSDADANPSRVRFEILSKYPAMSERIKPYIGGSEVANSPTHDPQRWAIFLSDLRSESDLDAWGPLAEVVRNRVKPYRDRLRDTPVNRPLRRRWWAYQAHRPQFYEAIAERTRILAICKVSPHLSFAFIAANLIYSQRLIVFNLDSCSAMAVLQGRVHEVWVGFCGGAMGDGYSYNPSDCFDTFPFPAGWQTGDNLESAGQTYYEFRAALMVARNEGMTETYNRFHDPEERDPEIEQLRTLHAAMDRAVLDAYGWTDLQPNCEFLLDYEIDEGDWSSRKKKPYRYRWPDDVRDEVLARLLELNAQRHAEEVRAGAHSTKKKATKEKASRKAAGSNSEGPSSNGVNDSAPSGNSARRKPKAPLDEGGLFA